MHVIPCWGLVRRGFTTCTHARNINTLNMLEVQCLEDQAQAGSKSCCTRRALGDIIWLSHDIVWHHNTNCRVLSFLRPRLGFLPEWWEWPLSKSQNSLQQLQWLPCRNMLKQEQANKRARKNVTEVSEAEEVPLCCQFWPHGPSLHNRSCHTCQLPVPQSQHTHLHSGKIRIWNFNSILEGSKASHLPVAMLGVVESSHDTTAFRCFGNALGSQPLSFKAEALVQQNNVEQQLWTSMNSMKSCKCSDEISASLRLSCGLASNFGGRLAQLHALSQDNSSQLFTCLHKLQTVRKRRKHAKTNKQNKSKSNIIT